MTLDAKSEEVPSVSTEEEVLAELKRTEIETETISFECASEIAQLIERLGFVPNDERAACEVQYGVQSGFPLCCIVFFASIWSKSILLPTNDLDELVTGDYRRLLATARRQGTLKAGYIPCPACLLTMIGPTTGRKSQ